MAKMLAAQAQAATEPASPPQTASPSQHQCDEGEQYGDAADWSGDEDMFLHEFLGASDDKREGHWVLALDKAPGTRKQLFGLVGMAEVTFSDGRAKWVSYCRNSCCKPTGFDQLLAGGAKHIDQASSWWTAPELCECAERLLPRLGGIEGVKRLFQHSQRSLKTEAVRLVVPLDEGWGTAVRAGPDFEHWAVVDTHSRCQTCTRGSSCGHASGEQAPDAAEPLSEAMSQQRLDKEFSCEEGGRKLWCRMTASRHLPERMSDDPFLHGIEQGLYIRSSFTVFSKKNVGRRQH
jgi:hypothetical protein